ncbi:MAG: alkaline phosphatase family protein [Candidatus Velthaea sp.]
MTNARQISHGTILGFVSGIVASMPAFALQPPAALAATAQATSVPRYQHVFVIVEENKTYEDIIGSPDAPTINALARTYGTATQFYGEVHPSEGNYVALVGGSTFGIHDDDAFFCKPRQFSRFCPHALLPGFANHTVDAPHVGIRLAERGFTWKGYYENIPSPGSLAVTGDDGGSKLPLYASKHSGFLNYRSAQTEPHRAEHITDFHALERDIAANTLPNFALIVPNQCNDMHGLRSRGAPPDCHKGPALIRRGDRRVDQVLASIMAARAWKSAANVAVVLTFDESAAGSAGCCGADPKHPSTVGGGHIATVVITNHGPRGIRDATAYNHASLLRTVEDAFRIAPSRANDKANQNVRPMVPLFATNTNGVTHARTRQFAEPGKNDS